MGMPDGLIPLPPSSRFGGTTSRPPKWIKPQLTRLVDEAPTGKGWVHEIKYDGYRMHARIDGGKATLLTRTGLDWSHRYRRTIEALASLKVKSVYLDGELCALNAEGVPVFSRRTSRRGRSCGRCRIHHGARYFFATENRSRLIRVITSAGLPRFRRACPDCQSLDGFTAGVGPLAHASKALLAEFCYLQRGPAAPRWELASAQESATFQCLQAPGQISLAVQMWLVVTR